MTARYLQAIAAGFLCLLSRQSRAHWHIRLNDEAREFVQAHGDQFQGKSANPGCLGLGAHPLCN